MQVNNPDEAAYFTILAMKEIAVDLKKCVKTIGFKRQHFTLFSRVVERLNLKERFIFEDKIKVVPAGKNTCLPCYVKG